MAQDSDQSNGLALARNVEPESPKGLRRIARTALKRVENVIGVSDDDLIAQLRQTIALQQQQLQDAERRLHEMTQGVRKGGSRTTPQSPAPAQKGLGARLRNFLSHTVEPADHDATVPVARAGAGSSVAAISTVSPPSQFGTTALRREAAVPKPKPELPARAEAPPNSPAATQDAVAEEGSGLSGTAKLALVIAGGVVILVLGIAGGIFLPIVLH